MIGGRLVGGRVNLATLEQPPPRGGGDRGAQLLNPILDPMQAETVTDDADNHAQPEEEPAR